MGTEVCTPAETSEKGLVKGQIGVLSAVVIGVGCIAPAYTLTSGLGPTIVEVGAHVPAILILGFLPMLLVAFGYRELNTRIPDSGTSFTWATKAFSPWIGWMGGWGLIASTVIVLSNLAAVAVDFFYILLGQLFEHPEIAELTRNLWINIPTTLLFIGFAAWISYRGLASTMYIQYALVAIQLIVLSIFAFKAILGSKTEAAYDPTPISLDWFNPAGIEDFSMLAAGVSLSIFMFWGWDATLTLSEETKNPNKTAGQASTLTVLIIICIYTVCAVGVVAWAGIGEVGLGAGNPENQESIFAVLAGPIMGPMAILMSVTVLASSFSSLNSTMISPSRTILSMSHYKALPSVFSAISPRYRTPSVATLSSAVGAGAFYTVTRLLSENALWDTITALGLMICFYYGITAMACVWYFRNEILTSVRAFFFLFLFPLLGGVSLLGMFVRTVIDSINPDYGSGQSVGGIGTVFIIGAGILLLGVILMMMTRYRSPAFFRGETLATESSTSIKV